MSKISIYDVVPVPKLADKLIGTSVGGDPEDLTYNFTLGDLLNLFIPNIPGNTLQGVLDFGNTATQDINLTGTINTTDLNVGGTLTILDSDFTGETHILGGLYDSLNSIGTAGQVLISTGTQVEWFTIPTVIPNLQQVLTSGNTAVNNIILTGDLSANNAALLTSTISTSLTLLGTLRDGLSSVGTNNQVLSSNVTGVRWINLPVYSAASPLLYNSATGVFSIQQANSSQSGYLSAADWITFDGKQTSIILTTTGNSGPSTLVGSTINVPNYTLAGLNGVPQTRILSINGVAYNLSADRSWTISAGVSSVTATTPLFSTGGASPVLSIQQSGSSLDGYLSSVDWLTFNNKQSALTLTTTGTSGPSTLIGSTLNIPQYTDQFVGTVTSVAALTLGTIGTDLSSTVANSTTTPVITLNVPTASAVNRGALSAADWTTFDSKQVAGNYITSLTGEATALGPGAAAVTLDNAAVTGKVLTGLNVTGGTVLAADSILTGFGKVQNQINGLIGGTIFQGTWNANTNTPALVSSVGTNGHYYIVSVAGTTNLDGITDWQVGDWAIFAGTTWEKVDNTDSVSSVNGFTGAVSLTTDNIPEGATNLYFTNTRARTAISLTTTGSSGASTYDNTTGVFNIPNYADQFVGTVTSVGLSSVTSGVTIGSTPITTSGIITIAIATATASQNGLLSSADWATFNGKQNAITLTTTGTSGVSTLVGSTLNIPNYTTDLSGYVPYNGATTNVDLGDFVLTSGGLNVDSLGGNGGALNLRQATSFSTWSGAPFTSIYATTGNRVVFSFSNDNRTFTLDGSIVSAASPRTFTFPDATGTIALVGGAGVGTVTSVSFSLGATGTDLSASVANSTTTPAITLNVPTASASARGALSAADWTTFNSKQNALTNPVTGTGAAGQVTYWSSSSTITGTSNFLFDASQRNLTIDRSLSTLGNAITISKGSDVDQAWLAFKQGGGASGTWRLGYSGDPYDFRISAGSDSSLGTQALRIFVGTQNVAIGTSTTDNGARLQVSGSDNNNIFMLFAGANSRLHVGTVTSPSNITYIRSQNNFALNLGVNSTDYLTILSSGNVGINTSSPTGKLMLYQSTAGNVFQNIASNQGGSTQVGINLSPSMTDDELAANPPQSSIYATDSNFGANIIFANKTTGAVGHSLSERMRITSGGSVGINNTSPMNSVWGTDTSTKQLSINGSSYAVINLEGSTGRKYSMGVGDGNFYMCYDNTDGRHNIIVSSVGNVLIGSATNTAGVKLRVAGGIIGCLDVYNNTTGAAANMQIDANGFFARSTSSIKYKKNVKDYTKGLIEVMQLRPVLYEGKSESDKGKIYAGLIAEEVHNLGLTEFVQYATDGSPDALSYQNMISLLTKAIQEQQEQIDSLKNQMQ